MNYKAQETDEVFQQLIEPEPDESPQAYAAFLHYIDLPPAERFAPETMEKIGEKFGLSPTTVKNYRSINRWTERLKLIDAHFAKIQFNERIKANAEHNLQFAAEARQIQSKAIKLSNQLLDVCQMLVDTAALGSDIKQTGWVKEWQPDGTYKSVPVTTQIFMEAKVSDIAPLFRVAVDVPNKVAGIPVEAVPLETQTMQGGIAGKTVDELKEMKRQLAKQRARLTGVNVTSEGVN